MALFRERVFTGGTRSPLMMWGFGLFGIYFFTSLYLQGVLGFSPTEAGAAFVPMALLMAAGAVVSERVAAPARRVPVGRRSAMLLMAAGHRVGQPARRGRGVPLADAELRGDRHRRRADGAADRHACSAPCRASEAGVASGIFNASREVAGLLGITVIGAVLTARQGAALRSRPIAPSTPSCPATSSACWSRPRWSPPAAWPRSWACAARAPRRAGRHGVEPEVDRDVPALV